MLGGTLGSKKQVVPMTDDVLLRARSSNDSVSIGHAHRRPVEEVHHPSAPGATLTARESEMQRRLNFPNASKSAGIGTQDATPLTMGQ